MAMLAEPRRKQKWSLDPRNSAWSNDDSKFGQKMLEKMGWSKGKGLGAQEQGATEHIKVTVKNNQLGLGATANHEDSWLAHHDEFNQLLAQLNSCHRKTEAGSSDSKEKPTFSLEEKSKSSRKRLHYMKFTKGKDLSSRSETDLNCIFGKRRESKEVAKEGPDPDSTEVEESSTVTSALTVQEYFAKRMAELQQSRKRNQDALLGAGFTQPPEDQAPGRGLQDKRKRRKSRGLQEEEAEEETEDEDGAQEATGVTERRRRKRKNTESQSPGEAGSRAEAPEHRQIGVCAAGDQDPEATGSSVKRKKRKKKKERKREVEEEAEEEAREQTQERTPPKKKKKKKKKREEEEEG
ncbi:PIN2/TERF1-interacting telomerase inhibitor 1 [Tachyglossus aculeatus]|uniref:PIN2/TERF1-interacting telomerase inhibitor 1 n=1 Tax=Tachyglossus aculeatus TaxID=9261 RepID=UPI0018F6B906|nr:PIN2/TERF1-interacting telomerase inhibitor 1 [Tachyglossus aculeatus]